MSMFRTLPAIFRFFPCSMNISQWLLLQLTWEVSFINNGIPNSLKDYIDKFNLQTEAHYYRTEKTQHTQLNHFK